MAEEKQAQLRARITQAQKEHLEQAAADGGYENLSDYVRTVLLEGHVVVVGGETGLVLIPAATSSEAGQAAVEHEIARVLEAVNRSAEVASPGPAPSAAPAAGAETGAVIPPAPVPDASPVEQLGQVAADVVAQTAPPSPEQAGSWQDAPPAPGETSPGHFCSGCGTWFPIPVSQAHNAEECAAIAAQRRAEGTPGTAPDGQPHVPEYTPAPGEEELVDARPLRADEINSDPNPPLGGPQPGETELLFFARRVDELKRDGRPGAVARAEAGAEWRRATGNVDPFAQQPAPAAAPSPPAPAPAPVSAQPRVCGRCGAVVTTPGACPECGA